MTRFLLLSDKCGFVFVGHSLTRRGVCRLQLLLALVSAVILRFESLLHSDSKLPFSSSPTTRRATVEVFDPTFHQGQSHVVTDGQPLSKSWCQASSGAHDQIFITLTVMVLSLWGALSEEMTGLSSVYAAGPRQLVVFGYESLLTRDHILLSEI
jgi:hypothetical protein